MRYVGIDIASEKHFVAVVDGASEVLLKSTPVGEDEAGYSKLFQLLGESSETLVAREATGHYWKNLYAAAKLIAELGNPAEFTSPAALAAYVGVVPATRQSGKALGTRAGITSMGHAELRHTLWMPVLTAVRVNPWLRQHYRRLRANGKPAKVALIAAMRKLLHAIYAVARDRRPFSPRLAGVPA